MTDKIQQWASNQVDLFNQSYFNTTGLTGTELSERIAKANNQNEVILGLFQRFKRMTPSECLGKYVEVTRLTPPPITSIRRAITVLTKSGKLVKLDSKKPGMYGDGEHEWRIKE